MKTIVETCQKVFITRNELCRIADLPVTDCEVKLTKDGIVVSLSTSITKDTNSQKEEVRGDTHVSEYEKSLKRRFDALVAAERCPKGGELPTPPRPAPIPPSRCAPPMPPIETLNDGKKEEDL